MMLKSRKFLPSRKFLRLIFREEIPFPYPNDFHKEKLLEDKATSHAYWIQYHWITWKSKIYWMYTFSMYSCRVSYVLFKKALSKHKPTMTDWHWKVLEDEE